jgi:hypothetical protein
MKIHKNILYIYIRRIKNKWFDATDFLGIFYTTFVQKFLDPILSIILYYAQQIVKIVHKI